jgi:hypothetical protein
MLEYPRPVLARLISRRLRVRHHTAGGDNEGAQILPGKVADQNAHIPGRARRRRPGQPEIIAAAGQTPGGAATARGGREPDSAVIAHLFPQPHGGCRARPDMTGSPSVIITMPAAGQRGTGARNYHAGAGTR